MARRSEDEISRKHNLRMKKGFPRKKEDLRMKKGFPKKNLFENEKRLFKKTGFPGKKYLRMNYQAVEFTKDLFLPFCKLWGHS